jgi:hypothetical protein
VNGVFPQDVVVVMFNNNIVRIVLGWLCMCTQVLCRYSKKNVC